MTMITEFTDQLFSFMALKYEIIATDIPRDANFEVEDLDWTASDEFTVDIGHAVLMLSYSYRSAFKKHFNNLSTLLSFSNRNTKLYAVIFAKVTYRSHSPLKILVLCAFISEMYIFLLFKNGSQNTIKDYVDKSTACFNNVYKVVLSRVDDPILKWTSVKLEASQIALGYSVFRPIMESEHPSENKEFFVTVQSLVTPAIPAEEAVRQAEELIQEALKTESVPVKKLQAINQNLYKTLKTQSRRFFPQVAQPLRILKVTTLEASKCHGGERKKVPNKAATSGATSTGVSLAPDSKVAKKPSKIPPKDDASKKDTTASGNDKSLAKGEATDVMHGAVIDQTLSNIPGIDGTGKAKSSKKSKNKRKNRGKPKPPAIDSVIVEEEDVNSTVPCSRIEKYSVEPNSQSGGSKEETIRTNPPKVKLDSESTETDPEATDYSTTSSFSGRSGACFKEGMQGKNIPEDLSRSREAENSDADNLKLHTDQSNVEGECLDKFSNLTVEDADMDQNKEDESEESGEESLV